LNFNVAYCTRYSRPVVNHDAVVAVAV